jgi:hypothetical protein
MSKSTERREAFEQIKLHLKDAEEALKKAETLGLSYSLSFKWDGPIKAAYSSLNDEWIADNSWDSSSALTCYGDDFIDLDRPEQVDWSSSDWDSSSAYC